MTSPIARLLQAVTDVINSHTKERAVTVGEIWQFLQNKLEVDAIAEAGNVNGGMMAAGNVVDVYIDSASTYALIAKEGKLYKAIITVGANDEITVGEYQEVVMEFAPVVGRQIQIKRQADGQVRWFAMPACTAALNRVGEIDSMALFDGFVEYIERTGNYPELDFYHMGESLPLGRADWVGRDGVGYCASGLFYDTPIARNAAKSLEAEPDYWGLSIAYIPTKAPEIIRNKEGIEIPVFNVGINRFISLLPENAAASILTSISTQEGVQRMNDKMKAALKKLTGEDEPLFNELVEKLDSVNRSAQTMITREDKTVTPETDEEFEGKIAAIVEKVLAAHAQPAPTAVVSDEKPVERDSNKELLSMITALSGKVDELMKSREASIKEVLDDLPAKITRQQIIRPRAAVVPAMLTRNQSVNLAEIAEETLARMTPEKQPA